MMLKKNASIYILLITLLLSYQNCGRSNKNVDSAANSSHTTYSEVKPSVDCKLTDSSGVVVRRIRSFTSSSQSIQTIFEDQNYRLDCGSTQLSDGSTSIITFELSNPTQSSSLISNQAGVFNLRYTDAGSYPLFVIATDRSTGLSTQMPFVLDVRCTQDSTLNLSSVDVQVTPKSTQGFFDFSVSGVTGGVGEYQYAWDFNGDQRTDFQPMSGGSWSLWSSQPRVTNVFSMFAGNRDVTLYVRDSCNVVKQVTKQKNFVLPWMTSATVSPDFTYYVQGKIRPNTPITSMNWTQADLSVRQPATVPDQRIRVYCSYPKVSNPGKRTFTVSAHNIYGSLSQTTMSHGLNFKVDNIPDSGAMGIQNLSSSVSAVQSLNYLVSESGDVAAGIKFSQNQSCTIQSLELERKIGSSTCSGDPTTPTKVVRFVGQFSCPSLRSGDGKTVKLQEAMFYCEAGDVQHCIGGPGGEDPGNPIPGW